MSIVTLRTKHERSLVELVAAESVSANLVALAPKIKEIAVLGALPIDHAMKMRTGRRKMLDGVLVAQMAKMVRIDDVQHALLAPTNYQVRPWDQDGSRRVKVVVLLI